MDEFNNLTPETTVDEIVQQQEQTHFPKERLQKLTETLQKYKAGKANLEKRIIAAEQYWKLRHWEYIREKMPDEPEPTSGWLVNVILSKHSDAMDAYPQAICLPREAGDKGEAQALTSIIPVILEQNQFETTWSDTWWYKLKSGTGVYGVFWDKSKQGGLGDISIRRTEILNLFWEPGVSDIQQSRYLFHVELQDNESLKERYPELGDKLDSSINISHYVYDDSISTSDKTAVVDCYYRVWQGARAILHYVKYVGEHVLYATEDDPMYANRGLYDHGKYPFVFDPLFPEEGYPRCGFGYVDLCKDPQKYVDILGNSILKNSIVGATPRYFVRSDGNVNEQEFRDMNQAFVHVSGNLSDESLRPIDHPPLSDIYVSVMQLKIDELKQTSGNRDVNNGGSTSGITAASAIAALQEAGNGLSRDMIEGSYRAFREVVDLCVELIRQFYTEPRTFRILGQYGMEQFIAYSNAGIQEQRMLAAAGEEMLRLPVFDIEVEVQKESQYTIATYNDLAVQLYQMGAFNPANADSVMMMLDMMEFKGKDQLMQKIAKNQILYQKMVEYMQMALMLAQQFQPDLVPGLSADIQQTMAGTGDMNPTAGQVQLAEGDAQRGGARPREHARVEQARRTAADSSNPGGRQA